MPSLTCPHCAQHLHAPDEVAPPGSEHACPLCGIRFRVGEAVPQSIPPLLPELSLLKSALPDRGLGPEATVRTGADIERLKLRARWATLISAILFWTAIYIAPSLVNRQGRSSSEAYLRAFAGLTIGVILALLIAALIASITWVTRRHFSAMLWTAYCPLVVLIPVGVLVVAWSNATAPLVSNSNLHQQTASREPAKGGSPHFKRVTTREFSAWLDQKVRLIKEHNEAAYHLLPVILDANRIAADSDGTESRALMAEWRISVDNTRKNVDEILARNPLRQGTSPTSPSEEDEYPRDQIEQLTHQVIDKCGAVIGQLYSRRGSWKVLDGKLRFTNTSDLEDYKRLRAELHQIIATRDQVIERANTQMNEKIIQGMKEDSQALSNLLEQVKKKVH